MISFERVHLTYPNGVRALSDINLEFEKGEVVFLAGPSGCGKSSLMKLIYLDERPSRGRVMVMGKDTFDYPAHQVPYLRRKVGVVFQDFKLLPNKTVRENVSFVLEVTGASRYELERKIPQVLELVGLAGKVDVFPGSLSGGEVQRVAIARAIVNEPLILLADEPTGNLDPETSWDIVQLLLRIQMRGTTVVVASHDMATVDRVKKRKVRMEGGRITQDG
ncbi:MAG: cell division ATP-binding protein FtsE [bacterium]